VEKRKEVSEVQQMSRIVRACLKRLYDLKHSVKPPAQQTKQEPNRIKLKMEVEDRNCVAQQLEHGRSFELGFDANVNPH
jgi:hypothetical protein